MTRLAWPIYAVLAAAWILALGWQAAEHARVIKSARAELVNRAKDISTTLGVVMRSQRRFGGVISKERLESTLKELVKPGELNAIALLNEARDVVASAGALLAAPELQDLHSKGTQAGEGRWARETVTLVNLVELGTNVTQDLATIVLPRNQMRPPWETNQPSGGERGPGAPAPSTNAPAAIGEPNGPQAQVGPPPPPPWSRPPRGTNDPGAGFRRPFWMTEEEFGKVSKKAGVHSMALIMSTAPVNAVAAKDFWLRVTIGFLASASVAGAGLAWRNLVQSSELRLRLVRASELNSHLKQMNLAAAGLAHETRNPLNIIRGLAQMISRQTEASEETRKRSREIIDETDRVTGQLNEFINFSRPRQVNRSSVQLGSVVNEVVRALSYDVQEKNIVVKTSEETILVEADEQLLRQALFNLVLNAVQALQPHGEIEIKPHWRGASDVCLDIRDNGPGVPADHRAEIFKPYFTTTQKGTGLGLAVVQQIVLAHGWEIECLPNEPRGALFRISHLKLVPTPA